MDLISFISFLSTDAIISAETNLCMYNLGFDVTAFPVGDRPPNHLRPGTGF